MKALRMLGVPLLGVPVAILLYLGLGLMVVGVKVATIRVLIPLGAIFFVVGLSSFALVYALAFLAGETQEVV
jgi:uncharacterized membrane protein